MTIALLHGFAGDPSVWVDVIAAWPASAPPPRAIALPGHGGAAGVVRATWDENLAAVGDAIGDAIAGATGGTTGGTTVVGYSLGARVALGLVASGRATRAILIGVNPGIDASERPARLASDAQWAALLRTRGTAAFADAWGAQPLFASQGRVPADRLARRRAHRDALDAEQLARSLEVMGLAAMPDYRGAVAAHARSLALIAGADDTRYVVIARALAAADPAIPLATIADSGHDPTLEQPVALAAAIGRALAVLAAS